MSFTSINPATEDVLAIFEEISAEALNYKLDLAEKAFGEWRVKSFSDRAKKMKRLAEILRKKKEELGMLITNEMGKPIKASKAEVEKCAWVCDYYADNAPHFLKPEVIPTDGRESFVQFDPLGIILAVMPWNFPFWQVFRAAAPVLMGGNVFLLKHASNVPQCGIKIGALFLEAGYEEGLFQNLLIKSTRVAEVIHDPRVKAVTLTGSEFAGSQVACECGKVIKKSVMELGGSDPFIILEDGDLEKACVTGIEARFQNSGQSCIAAKRFIVVKSRYQEFLEKYLAALSKKVVGDPKNEATDMGPLATKSTLEDIVQQVQKSVALGATVVRGGKRKAEKGFFYEPTVITNVKKGMPVYDEETFGPVAALVEAHDSDDAIEKANQTIFGLGASLWTSDIELAKKLVSRIQAGAVFINGIVKSDPRLPFGGINKSGYGRELSHYGLKEFMNVKAVWVG